MCKYKVVLFDLDGTVINSDVLLVNVYNKLFEKYGNLNNTTLEQMYYFSGPSTASTMKTQFPQENTEKMVKEYDELSRSAYENDVTLYPGAAKCIAECKQMGLHVGVITNKHKPECEFCYKCLKLENTFENTVTCTDVEHPKPAPDSVYKAMDFFGIENKEEIIYVGDNTSDYLTAKNAGIDSVIVKWGPRKQDPSIQPTYFINTFDDLMIILRGK